MASTARRRCEKTTARRCKPVMVFLGGRHRRPKRRNRLCGPLSDPAPRIVFHDFVQRFAETLDELQSVDGLARTCQDGTIRMAAAPRFSRRSQNLRSAATYK